MRALKGSQWATAGEEWPEIRSPNTILVGQRVCAGVNVSDPCGGVRKHISVAVSCSGGSVTLLDGAVVGPAFRDLYPPDPSAGPQLQTEAASGLAAMDAAPASLISDELRAQLGDMLVQLALSRNHSSGSDARVAITGGIIDMAHLAPELLNHGHPDLAFDVLSADGPATYYNMAKCECDTPQPATPALPHPDRALVHRHHSSDCVLA